MDQHVSQLNHLFFFNLGASRTTAVASRLTGLLPNYFLGEEKGFESQIRQLGCTGVSCWYALLFVGISSFLLSGVKVAHGVLLVYECVQPLAY